MLASVMSRVSDAFAGGARIPARTGNAGFGVGVGPESRKAPRHETEIAATLCLIGREHDCVIRNVSIHGMTISVEGVPLCVGLQVLVTCVAIPTLCGIIRWIGPSAFGVQFVKPLGLDQVYQMRNAIPAGMQPRAGRARVKLPAVARFSDQTRKVEVQNLSVGGLMIASALPPKPGQHLMIELPEMLPIGGHVRWTAGGRCGVMFSKLLSVTAAEQLAGRYRIPEAWLEEARLAHQPAPALEAPAL